MNSFHRGARRTPGFSFISFVLVACADGPVNRTDGGADASVPLDSHVTSDAMVPADTMTPPPDATPTSRCDPSLPRLEPASYDDTTYAPADTTRVPCTAEACLCNTTSPGARQLVEGLLRCEPIAGGFEWGQGSGTLRVLGRHDRKCVVEIFRETEGGGNRSRCELPLPVVPWAGLATTGDTANGSVDLLHGIESYCTPVESCCLITGCANPCSADVLTCPALASTTAATSFCGNE